MSKIQSLKKTIIKEFNALSQTYPTWVIHTTAGVLSGLIIAIIFNKWARTVCYLLIASFLIFFVASHFNLIIIDYRTVSKLCGFSCHNHHDFFNNIFRLLSTYKIYSLSACISFFMFFKGFPAFRKISNSHESS